jgi:hypothetical protein
MSAVVHRPSVARSWAPSRHCCVEHLAGASASVWGWVETVLTWRSSCRCKLRGGALGNSGSHSCMCRVPRRRRRLQFVWFSPAAASSSCVCTSTHCLLKTQCQLAAVSRRSLRWTSCRSGDCGQLLQETNLSVAVSTVSVRENLKRKGQGWKNKW